MRQRQFSASARKVDIFVAGFQKCGTSALCDLLDRHPSVGVCRPKEPAWFSGGKLARSENEYLSLFPQDKRLWIDGSTAYSFPEQASEVARRIHRHNPCAKFIFVVRNPVNRVNSAMNHRILENAAAGDRETAFDRAVARSAYYSAISRFLEYFPQQSLLVISMGELFASEAKPVYEFLRVEATRTSFRRINHTLSRRKENGLTNFYRRHWRLFNRLAVQRKAKHWIGHVFERTLMRKPAPGELQNLSTEQTRQVKHGISSDARQFEARFRFDYMVLDK